MTSWRLLQVSQLYTSLPAYPKVKSWTSMCIGCSFETSPFVATTADIFVCFCGNQYASLLITPTSWSRINGHPGDTWLLLSSSSSSWRPHAWRKWNDLFGFAMNTRTSKKVFENPLFFFSFFIWEKKSWWIEKNSKRPGRIDQSIQSIWPWKYFIRSRIEWPRST